MTVYVEISDLDRTYTTETYPQLAQVNNYIDDANKLVTTYLASTTRTINFGGDKVVAKLIVENYIHNRYVKDNMPGYQFYRPTSITLEMKDILFSNTPWSTPLSFNPGAGNQGGFI